MQEIQASFLHPFSYAALGEGGHISGGLFWRFLALNLLPTLQLEPHPPVTGALKWEILGSALGSPFKGAPGNRVAPGGAPESAQREIGGAPRVRKISPKFSCIKFFQIQDVPTQIPGHPGHSLSKTTDKGHLHKVFVRDIPTSGSRMSQEYPAQNLYV